jgi:hypothetical protein
MSKAEDKFEAILAKNRIARQLARLKATGEEISINVILEDLKAIEKVIGQSNQPSVEDIFENNTIDNLEI